MSDDSKVLRERYESIALSKDDKTTAEDFLLRELEIDLGSEYIRDGDNVLDVGCGLGYALRKYASARSITAHGIDYAQNMIEVARERLAEDAPQLEIDFRQASVTELPYSDNEMDVVTSHRCLMALLDWDLQKRALQELHRVLKPGGYLVLMEGTKDGVDRLNYYRRMFGLSEIDPAGRNRLTTLKFDEAELLRYVEPLYELERIHRFGMYYFLTRIIQPLLVAPEAPSYDHRLNHVAREIAKLVPDFEQIGHLRGFILRKKV